MSDTELDLVMYVAAGDVGFAEAVEAFISDAVDGALRTAEGSADTALAGHAAGRRFRSAVTCHQMAIPPGIRTEPIARTPARRPPLAAPKERERRADAFRRMAGVRN